MNRPNMIARRCSITHVEPDHLKADRVQRQAGSGQVWQGQLRGLLLDLGKRITIGTRVQARVGALNKAATMRRVQRIRFQSIAGAVGTLSAEWLL